MTGPEFRTLITRLGDAWSTGSAEAAAACFAESVDYGDPLRYRFATREQVGTVEYTYDGHHQYHGAAIVEVDEAGLIRAWREWQHVDDERDWAGFVAGPGAGPAAAPRG